MFEILDINCDGILLKEREEISSQYFYTPEGVYRKSKHWGDVKKCRWTLNGKEKLYKNYVIGFCKWEDFKLVINKKRG